MFVAVRAWTGGAALGAMHSGRVTSPPVEAPKTSSGFQLLRRAACGRIFTASFQLQKP